MNKIIIIGIALIFSVTGYSQTILSLQQSKNLAIKNNMAIKNSILEINAAQETKKNAFTNYFPKVSGTAFGMYAIDPLLKMDLKGGNLPVYDGNPANLPNATQFAYFPDASIGILKKMGLGLLNVTQPVYAGGKIKTGNKLAALNIEVKEKQQKLAENEVLLKTEQQYWQLVTLQEKKKTLNKYEDLLRAIAKQVNDAFKAGLIIKNDVLKVQLKQSELQINKIKLQNGKKLALMQFCQTIGIDYDSTLTLQDDLQVIENPYTFYVVSDSVLKNRTEYRLLEQSVEAARLQTEMKKGDYLPQVAVGVAGYYNNSLTRDVNATTNGLAYATVSIPISDWWGGKHAIKEQKIKEQITKNTFEDRKGLLKLQMEKAWTDVTEAYQQIMIMEQTTNQADENLKVNRDSYNNGIVTISDLLEALALQTETADKLTEAKTNYKLAITVYLQVTGRINNN
ncbi:MAG: TolC family protein [Lacibacter sp.]|jgi:outer membrane protein TolC